MATITADWLSSRFARMHVRPLNCDNHLAKYRLEWSLIEWSKSKDESINYWLSALLRLPSGGNAFHG
jgi:hypothetical protein